MPERVHMVGIGGIGMSALARILLARGTAVSGSDLQASEMTDLLAALGASVAIGHRAELVEGARRVVVSDAIRPDNPELRRAEEVGLAVQRRSELMAELMAERRGMAVSGTHGKTTVTAMVGAALVEAGLDPTVVLGGSYQPLGGNARVGEGPWFVAEACEAYESFLDLRFEIAVVTNIEADHLDHHKTEAHLRESFAAFLARLPPTGCAVLCADRPEVAAMAQGLACEVMSYGFEEGARVRGTEAWTDRSGGGCRLRIEGEAAGELRVGAPGIHNVMNGLGAIAAALRAGAPPAACQRALAAFKGVERRFEVLGEADGATVVDDYAHHPTEVSATIAAARSAFPGRRLIAVFQPHLYSRTRDFAQGFAQALMEADLVVLTDIYPARESALPGVTSRLIAEQVGARRGKDAVLEMAKEEVATELRQHARAGDVILVMGAGDIGEVARALARRSGGGPAGKPGVAVKR